MSTSSEPPVSRRPRHARADAPQAMREGANDRQIVQLVYAYRVLSQEQLQRLLGKSRSTVQRLLRRLYDHRYLERVFLPVAQFGSSPALYILDRRGVELLQRLGVADFTGQPAKQLSPLYLEHTLAMNDFRIAVAQACERHGWAIARWLTENEIKADYDRVRVPGKARSVALVPDSYFSLHIPDKGTTHFFLELDRGTMTVARFREKVEAYVAYYKSGAYTRRYGARGFRVLTVVDGVGVGRVENLVKAAGNVPAVGRRFWFAHLAQVAAADPLTEAVWRLPGQQAAEALVEPA